MPARKEKILDEVAIQQKIRRIAYQIIEQNFDEKEIVLLGIKHQGYELAKKLAKNLEEISQIRIMLHSITIKKELPTDDALMPGLSKEEVNNKVVVIVDDVANTGKTLSYALRPLLYYVPKKIQVAVLVDREHKSFPVVPDFVGLRLSTTLREHVTVELSSGNSAVYLS